MSYNYFQQTLVPSTTAWSVGTVDRPFKDIWLSYGSLNLANRTSGITGIALNNEDNYLVLGQGSAGFKIRDVIGNTTYQIASAGTVTMYLSSIPANTSGGLSIIGSTSRTYQPVTSPGVMVHVTGNDGQNCRLVYDTFGAGAFTQFISRTARGTANSPSPTLSGDTVFRLTSNTYNSISGFILPTGGLFSPTTIEAVASENHTTSIGTEWRIYNATPGDTTVTKRLNALIDYKGITVPTSGAGITFGDGTFQQTAFNALTGTWVPRLSSLVGNTAFGFNPATTGKYVKNGKNVYATFSVVLSALNTNSGVVDLTNLPFPVVNNPGTWGDLRFYRYVNLDNKATAITGGTEGNPTNFTLYYVDNTGGGSSTRLTVSNINATTALYGAMNYISSV